VSKQPRGRSDLVRVEIDVATTPVLVQVSGELDIATAPVLQECATFASDLGQVELDLSAVTFFDVAALRTLVLLAHERAGRIHLGPTSTAVDLVLDVFGSPLDRAIDLTDGASRPSPEPTGARMRSHRPARGDRTGHSRQRDMSG
jgi:anti-anti-sigma factor